MLKNLTITTTVMANGEEIFATIETVASLTRKNEFELRISLPNVQTKSSQIADLHLAAGKDTRSETWYKPMHFQHAETFEKCCRNALQWISAHQQQPPSLEEEITAQHEGGHN